MSLAPIFVIDVLEEGKQVRRTRRFLRREGHESVGITHFLVLSYLEEEATII